MARTSYQINYEEELGKVIAAGEMKEFIGHVVGWAFFMADNVLDMETRQPIKGKDQAFFDNLAFFLHQNKERIDFFLKHSELVKLPENEQNI